MFRVAVYETDVQRKDILHDCLTRYSFEREMDMDVFWFTDRQAAQKLERYADELCLALVSLEEDQGRQFGSQLYRLNPACRICYYKTVPCDLKPLLVSRPIHFFLWQPEQTDFSDRLDVLIAEIEDTSDFFCYVTRQEIYHLPVSSILYFESDLKHVLIHCKNGQNIRIFAKLSDIEGKLGKGFVRIHKSYFVNRFFVQKLDRKAHTCCLIGGEALPVSDVWYGQVANIFARNNREGD